MRKFIPYIAFVCLTGFTATNGLPVYAKGCSSQMNKTAEIQCAEDDIDCQSERAKIFDFKANLLEISILGSNGK